MLLMGGPQDQILSFLPVKFSQKPEKTFISASRINLYTYVSPKHIRVPFAHIQSSTSVLSGVQSVSRVKELWIQQPDANVVNQHNKYSDK